MQSIDLKFLPVLLEKVIPMTMRHVVEGSKWALWSSDMSVLGVH
jgi:hypothetical protein